MSSEKLQLKYDAGDAGDVAVRKKYSTALTEAKAFEQFGGKIMKIKLKALSSIGDDLQKIGVKKIGHGRIVMTGEESEAAIAKCDERIEFYSSMDPPCDPQIIISLLEVRLGYTRLMLDSGKAHIDADKAVSLVNKSNNIAMSFPQGQPMVVAVGPTNTIEDTKPEA